MFLGVVNRSMIIVDVKKIWNSLVSFKRDALNDNYVLLVLHLMMK